MKQKQQQQTNLKISDVITREVTDEQIQNAQSIRADRDKKYGNLYKEKATDLRWVGDLGEVIINQLLCMCRPKDTVWHLEGDVCGKEDFTFCGKTFDVKTVKRSVPVKLGYMAQISAKHISTKCDYLVFANYEYKTKKMNILGVMTKEDFIKRSIKFSSGDKVHDKYQIRSNHEIYAVYIYQLTPFRDFIRQSINDKIQQKEKECIKCIN